jgi:glycosyltransferase involved in cell wall biosynthesis
VWSEQNGPSRTPKPHGILFFGRLSAYKGLDVLYAALPAIAERVPDVRVVIAGRPSPGFIAPALPTLPDTAEVVTHFGPIDASLLRCLFEEASVVVLPYVEASQSGVAQTAYAFGKPVVASAVGGLPEDVVDGETGCLVPTGDPAAVARAVGDLLLDPARRARMTEVIRTRSAAAWPSIATRLDEIYRCMLEH